MTKRDFIKRLEFKQMLWQKEKCLLKYNYLQNDIINLTFDGIERNLNKIPMKANIDNRINTLFNGGKIVLSTI